MKTSALHFISEQMKMAFICKECNREYNGWWCKPCNSAHFKNEFDKWTSENETIDKFIQDAQLNVDYYKKIIEWIPYDRFQGIKEIAKGGFGTVYYAKWINGRIGEWDIKSQQWKRDGQREVALKKINGTRDIKEDFLNEMVIHLRTIGVANSSIRFYGITKDPETHKYMMVLRYLEDGNLRNFLNNNFNNINWENKFRYLKDLALDFHVIHLLDIIHRDFHPGNILSYNFKDPVSHLRISDFGLSKLIGKNVELPQKRNVFGVLPYIAPEVLGGEEYTKAADVYSFAIIAYEIVTGFQPYSDVTHDNDLALKICNGLRPKIPHHIPKLITLMIMRCWDARITCRPTFEELWKELDKYYYDYKRYKNGNDRIAIQIKEAEEFSKNQETTTTTPSNYKTHPRAIYTSRLFDFSNLPKPMNEENFEKELEELTESFSYIITNDDIKF
ncbi:hypothetical protein Glove_139g362 [Diversispora epigaea]|uniref:Protein kinase domain-containing protein n=1 Tax=Diversispora epigaea TaxID=1348612 RepID=A0A397IZV6_9GLOM|nr:hypothetical protein Glove_139g362 [Diversispora epigaea]